MTEVVASLQALGELQEKSNTELSATMSFTWMMPKYWVYAINPNSAQNGTNALKSPDNNMNQQEELVNQTEKTVSGRMKKSTYEELKLVPWLGNKFTYDELKLVTWLGNKLTYGELKLDTWLGNGRYGMVYKGWVDITTNFPPTKNTELPIAVKMLHQKKLFDLEMLKEIVHPNLVNLIGYGLEGEQHFLVYEFMHKGNLADLLRSGAVARLPLVKKVKIIVGIARGIVFLQKISLQERRSGVSEFWLERHKILLDEDFTAKLSDYDVSTLVDDEYKIANHDVDGALELKCSTLSSYEVVFVEVLTGERIYSSNTLEKIDRLFHHCGKESLQHTAQLCFEICNEVDSESKMLTMLDEHDVLIRSRLKLWLRNTHS